MSSPKTGHSAKLLTPSTTSEELRGDHKYIAVLEDNTTLLPPTTMNSSALTDAFPDVAKQDTTRDVAELRATYESGATRDLKQRRALLLQLQTLMREGEPLLKEAMWKDLHKHPTESFACEIAVTVAEIQEHLDYLEDWAKPQLVGTNIANLPGLSYIHKDPLGVVCIIGTWNYPVNLLITPLISALAAGNCAVVRLPGDDTTRFLNNVLISLFDKYMDKRFVRYVYGGVEETKAMLRERYDLIFATGGCFLGKIVARAAAEHLTPTVLELGGKSPAIIDETADIELTARRLTWGSFTNAGQTCVRPDYVLVDERVGDKLVAAVERVIKQFYGQDPLKSDCYGRIVNNRMFTRLANVVKSDAARITHGGATDEKERYIEPTLLNFKTDLQAFTSSAAMQEELFGPILPIYYYRSGDIDWAVNFVTKRDKPLALYLYSTSARNKKKVTTETTSGSMVVNDSMMQLANSHLPFGGVGTSGNGAYHGRAGFDAFSHKKAVMYKYSLLDLAQRYAPYSPASEKVLRLVLYPITRTQLRVGKLLAFIALIVAIAFGIRGAVKK